MNTQYKEKTNKELEKLILENDFYAINEIGERLFKEEKYKEALNYFKKAANLGSDMAINNIGFFYLEIENNLQEAEKYFLKAIERKNIIALNNLGIVNDRKGNYEKAIEITLAEFKKLRESGVTEDELQKAKNKYMSRIAFSMENPRSRMGILGNYYIRKNEILDAEKIKNEVNSVKLEDVNNFAKTGYLTENITVLGNIKK